MESVKTLLGIREGASIVETIPVYDRKQREREVSLRGAITKFSSSSRLRLQKLLASFHRERFVGALFLTLTYPDQFPKMPKVKRDLDNFLKRVRRKFPTAGGIWRLEFIDRKSGVNTGEYAPHLHLLVFGVGFMPYEWLAQSWYEVVGSNDPNHLRSGTSVRRVYSYRHACAYVSKYLAKVGDEILIDAVGRFWGTFGEWEKFVAPIHYYLVDPKVAARFARVLDGLRRASIRSRKKKNAKSIGRSRKRKKFIFQKAFWFVDVSPFAARLGDILGVNPASVSIAN